MNSQKPIGSRVVWTNEKHVDYINSMEASFVRTMFENNGRLLPHLRLDRYLPDSSDSTMDLNLQRRKKRTTPVNQTTTTNDKKTRRRLPSQRCNSLQDQSYRSHKHVNDIHISMTDGCPFGSKTSGTQDLFSFIGEDLDHLATRNRV